MKKSTQIVNGTQAPTIFSLLCLTCGLSQAEAANYLDEPIDTVRSWATGRRSTPDSALSRLYTLAQFIEGGAKMAVSSLKNLKRPISFDDLPRSRDFPSGAHHAMLGRIIALLPDDTEYE